MRFDFREMAFRIFAFFRRMLEKVFRWVNANLIPFKSYDLMVYRELVIDYLLSFLIISLIVWLKEVYLIYTQYIQKGAQFSTTLMIFIYSLPYTMAITIPAGMVMAAILTFNKMSINLEVLAIRGIGVKKIRMFLPVLVFSLGVSIFGYWFFDTILIKGNEMYIRENIKMRVEKPLVDVVPGQFITLSNFKIGFVEVNGNYLEGIEIYQDTPDSTRIIKASRGEIVSTGDEPYYVIKLYEGSFLEKPKGKKGEIFSSQFKYSELRVDYEISYIPKYDISRSPRVMSRYKLKRIIEEMERQKAIKEANEELTHLYSQIYLSFWNAILYFPSYVLGVIKNSDELKSLFNLAVDNVKRLKNKIKSVVLRPAVSEYNFFVLEYHKKTSIPFSSVFYGLLGFAFGMLVRIRTGKGESLIIGIIVILIQTYLTMIAEIPVRAGDLNPVLGAWIGNIVIGIPALYLLFRERI